MCLGFLLTIYAHIDNISVSNSHRPPVSRLFFKIFYIHKQNITASPFPNPAFSRTSQRSRSPPSSGGGCLAFTDGLYRSRCKYGFDGRFTCRHGRLCRRHDRTYGWICGLLGKDQLGYLSEVCLARTDGLHFAIGGLVPGPELECPTVFNDARWIVASVNRILGNGISVLNMI